MKKKKKNDCQKVTNSYAKKTYAKKIKTNTLVKFDFESLSIEYHKSYPFTEKDQFVFLGDIVQMPGHCTVVRIEDGKVFCCYHTDNFVKVPDEEC